MKSFFSLVFDETEIEILEKRAQWRKHTSDLQHRAQMFYLRFALEEGVSIQILLYIVVKNRQPLCICYGLTKLDYKTRFSASQNPDV